MLKEKIKKLFLSKFVKYAFGGGIAAIIDLLFLYIFVDIYGFHYIIGAILAFCISFFFGFLYQKYITFGNHDKKHVSQGFRFLVFQLLGLGINVILLYVFVDIFGFYYLYIAILNKFIVFVWNFVMNNYFNFR